MTLKDFLLNKTHGEGLCVISENGNIRAITRINPKDLFMKGYIQTDKALINLVDKKCDYSLWKDISIPTGHGDMIRVPCHYIYI